MDQNEEKRQLNTEYVQSVLNTRRQERPTPLAARHLVVVTDSEGEMRGYWVIDPDGKALEPFVSRADLTKTNPPELMNLTELDSRYDELVAFHRKTSDDDPQLEPSYNPAENRTKKESPHRTQISKTKVVMDRRHKATLRDIGGWEKEDDEGFSM